MSELSDLKQEVAANNVLLEGVGKKLDSMQRELGAQRAETAVRVEGLRAEQHKERRVRMMAVAAGGASVVYGYDAYVQHCSPGARVVRGVNQLIAHPSRGETPPQRQATFQNAYNHASPWCDVIVPWQTHDGSPWPSPANYAGDGVLLTLVLLVAVYHRWRTRQDFARVAKAAQSEKDSNDRRGNADRRTNGGNT